MVFCSTKISISMFPSREPSPYLWLSIDRLMQVGNRSFVIASNRYISINSFCRFLSSMIHSADKLAELPLASFEKTHCPAQLCSFLSSTSTIHLTSGRTCQRFSTFNLLFVHYPSRYKGEALIHHLRSVVDWNPGWNSPINLVTENFRWLPRTGIPDGARTIPGRTLGCIGASRANCYPHMPIYIQVNVA